MDVTAGAVALTLPLVVPRPRAVGRFEHDLNLLPEARNAGYAIRSAEIATGYLIHNSVPASGR